MSGEISQFDEKLKERLLSLPDVVQQAILSSEVEAHLRKIADASKLHVDQWQILENEVMLALLGFLPVEELEKDIQNKINIDENAAHVLVTQINKVVFEPIRQELERQLEHPEAQAATQSGIEAARMQILGTEGSDAPASTAPPAPVVPPATPPAPKPETPVAKAPASGAYKPGEASTERKSIADDPYREPPQ